MVFHLAMDISYMCIDKQTYLIMKYIILNYADLIYRLYLYYLNKGILQKETDTCMCYLTHSQLSSQYV